MNIVLLKNDGKFDYEDYKGSKAALRLNDLEKDNFQNIYRSVNDKEHVAVIVSADWFDGKISGFGISGDDLASYKVNFQSDDYLGRNLSSMINMVNDTLQVKSQAALYAKESQSQDQHCVYGIYDTKKFFTDGNIYAVKEDNQKIGGRVRAYLVSRAFFNVLNASTEPIDGKGFLTQFAPATGSAPESFTLTCKTAIYHGGIFSVEGSISGVLPDAAVGVDFNDPAVSFRIEVGEVDFVVGDVFTMNLVSAGL